MPRPRSAYDVARGAHPRGTGRTTASSDSGGGEDMADHTLLRKYSSAVVLAA